MNSKDIENKIKGLYAGVDSNWLTKSDAYLLGRERAGLAQKEFWANADSKIKQIKRQKAKKINIDTYSVGTYIVRSPGNDLLDFYDAQWQQKINNAKNNILPIPPSCIFKFRYLDKKPIGIGNNQLSNVTITSVFKETCKPYADNFPSWKVGKHPQFYSWLTNKKSVQKTFRLGRHAVEYLTKIKGSPQRGLKLSVHSDNPVHEQMFWKGPLAGYSIIFLED